MRSDLAPFAVDVVLALAGLGILSAAGLLPKRGRSILGALGLAYLVGAAVIPVVLLALFVVGVPFTLLTFLVVALGCVAIAEVRLTGHGPMRPRAELSWAPEVVIFRAFVMLFGAFAVIGFFGTFNMPLDTWDAWALWGLKAQMLFAHDLPVIAFFTEPTYAISHPDYPLHYPMWEALHFRAGGSFDTQDLLRHVWLLYVAFVGAVAYLVHEHGRPVAWVPVLLLMAAAPGVWQYLITGYADLPMAMFACLAALSLGLWLTNGVPGHLVLATIMLAATGNVKNEGLMIAAAMLLVAGAIVLKLQFKIRAFSMAGLGVVFAILPWRVWTALNGVEGDLPISEGLKPWYLIDRFDRVRPTIEAINDQLADQGQWLYLLPLAGLVVAGSLLSGVGRRAAVFYLGTFVLVWFALVWSYWISPHDLGWHLARSVDRVVAGPMLVCGAAVLHLSCKLVDSLSLPTSLRPPRETDDRGAQ